MPGRWAAIDRSIGRGGYKLVAEVLEVAGAVQIPTPKRLKQGQGKGQGKGQGQGKGEGLQGDQTLNGQRCETGQGRSSVGVDMGESRRYKYRDQVSTKSVLAQY